MKKAVFLDKDGTLVDNLEYPEKIPRDDIYFDNTVEGLLKLQENDYELIIISNQSWISRGLLSIREVEQIFKSLIDKYAKRDVKISGYYYCPHKKEEGCGCRKPKIGLLERAVNDFNIDVLQSYFVGDSDTDILTGKNFGLRTCIVGTGNQKENSGSTNPDYEVNDVNAFARLLLQK